MFVRYIKQCCSDCKSVLDEPALCLLCGRLCSPSWKPCCRYAVHPSSLGFIKIMWLQHTQPDLFNINFFFDSIMFKVNNYIPIFTNPQLLIFTLKGKQLSKPCNGLWCWYWCIPVDQGMLCSYLQQEAKYNCVMCLLLCLLFTCLDY